MGYRIKFINRKNGKSEGYATHGTAAVSHGYGRPGGNIKFKSLEGAQKYANFFRKNKLVSAHPERIKHKGSFRKGSSSSRINPFGMQSYGFGTPSFGLRIPKPTKRQRQNPFDMTSQGFGTPSFGLRIPKPTKRQRQNPFDIRF